MKFKDAVKKFDRANERGRIPKLEGEGYRSLTSSRRNAAVSAARAGLRKATDAANVGGVELDPYAEALPQLAYRDAKRRALASPGNYASDARVFLAGVEGKTYQRQRQGRRRVLPPWRPAYDALCAFIEDSNRKHLGLKAAFIKLQNVALVRGVDRPEDLPNRDTVEAWVDEDGVSDSYLRKMLRAIRYIRETMDDPTVPNLKKHISSTERGVRSLEDINERLQQAGVDATAGELSIREILEHIAPKIAEGVHDYLGDNENLGPDARATTWNASSRLVAEAARLGVDLSEFDHVSAFQSTIEEERELSGQVTRRLTPDQTPDAQAVSPMSRIIEMWASKSWANSPLELARDYSGKPYLYTKRVVRDMKKCFAMAAKDAEDLKRHLPEVWRDVAAEEDRLDDLMEEHNDQRTTIGHKNKARIIEAVTLPQLVCIGLPALGRQVRRYRDAYFRRVEKHEQGRVGGDTLHDCKTRYFKWLFRYVVTAVLTDDGLRVKNYAGATLGRNVFVDYETEEHGGEECRVGVEELTTHFRGYRDPPEVRLKKADDENEGDRERKRELLPGVVDHELLTDYLLQVRPYKLVQAGLLPSEDAFSPGEDEFALFASPDATNEDGRYGTGALRNAFGRSLHWICEEVLGRDVPAWNSDKRTGEWRGLFGPHVTRLLIGSYWGGIRGDWTYAEFLTDDDEQTLRKSYNSAASDVLQRKYQQDGWEHPEHFDDLMDRIRTGEEIDWETVRRECSLP